MVEEAAAAARAGAAVDALDSIAACWQHEGQQFRVGSSAYATHANDKSCMRATTGSTRHKLQLVRLTLLATAPLVDILVASLEFRGPRGARSTAQALGAVEGCGVLGSHRVATGYGAECASA